MTLSDEDSRTQQSIIEVVAFTCLGARGGEECQVWMTCPAIKEFCEGRPGTPRTAGELSFAGRSG